MAKLSYVNRKGELNLSYSKRGTLHECPRKFQIIELNGHSPYVEGKYTNLTFAMGHAVAGGVQALFAGATINQAKLISMAHLNIKEFWETDTKGRSVESLFTSIDLFVAWIKRGPLKDWVVAKFRHPITGEIIDAIELDFLIQLGPEANFQGHIDLVLYNASANIFMVVELKTAARYHETSYRNSTQTLGYSLIIDHIIDNSEGLLPIEDPDGAKASNQILYLVFDLGDQSWQTLPLNQSGLAKSEFIQELLFDIADVARYSEAGLFPKRSSACMKWNKPCPLYGSCDLLSLRNQKRERSTQYDEVSSATIEIDISSLIKGQLEKQQIEQGEFMSHHGGTEVLPNLTISEGFQAF